MKILFAILTLVFSIAGFAQNCDFSVNGSNVTATLLDTDQVLQQNFTISRGSNSGNCSGYRVYISRGGANTYSPRKASAGSKTINYNLHPTINMSGVLKDVGDATSSAEWVDGNLPNRNTNYSDSYFVSLPDFDAQNFPDAGNYTDNVLARIYSVRANGNLNNLEITAPLSLTFIVSKIVDVSLVAEGGTFNENSTTATLDFGFLAQNQELGTDIMVRSNTPYTLRMSSMNNGVLKNGSQSVAYQMRVGGVTVNLASSGGTPVTIGSGTATGSSGRRSNVRVKITEDTSAKPSGTYQDALTITAIAN